MAVGDVTQPKYVRISSNERADTIDVNALSAQVRDNIDAATRATLLTPRATAAAPTGTILTGFSLTPNPVAGDGKVRVNGELSIAIDADGHFIVKPASTTVDVTIPSDALPHQVYVYAVDNPADSTSRRFLPVSSPFTEYTKAVETTYQAGYGFYVRSGGAASIVASDSVNGRTRALVCIGIATNNAGTVTLTGYDATNAPNGTDIINRLSSVFDPGTLPTLNTRNGALRTFDDKTNAALFLLGKAKWQGSSKITPAAGNNYGAYSSVVGGVDAAFRGKAVVTIGKDSSSIYGNIDLDDYVGNHSGALAAAIALLPASGGTVLIKSGVQLTLSADVTLPADKSIRFKAESWQNDQIAIDQATYKFACASSSGIATLVFDNIAISTTNASATGSLIQLHDGWQLIVLDSSLSYSSVYAGAASYMISYNGAALTLRPVWLLHSQITWGNADAAHGGGIFSSGSMPLGDFTAQGCRFTYVNIYYPSLFYIQDVRSNVVFDECVFTADGTTVAASTVDACTAINLAATSNTAADSRRRQVTNCSFRGFSANNRNLHGIKASNVGQLRVVECDFASCVYGVYTIASTTLSWDQVIENNTFNDLFGDGIYLGVTGGSAPVGARIQGNVFHGPVSGASSQNAIQLNGTGTFYDVQVLDNRVYGLCINGASGNYNGLLVDRNRVAWTSAAPANYVPITLTPTASVIGVSVCDNHLSGGRGTSNVSQALGVYIKAGTFERVMVDRNRISDCDNIAYSGASALIHAVVLLQGTTYSEIQINDNVFHNVGSTLSGALVPGFAPWLIKVTSLDDTTVNATGRSVQINGNQIGDDTSWCSLVRVARFIDLKSLTVQRNVFVWKAWDVTLLDANQIALSIGADASTVMSNVSIIDNSLRFIGNSGAALSFHAIVFYGTFRVLKVLGNNFMCSTINGLTANYGIAMSSATIDYLTFDNNSAYIEGDTTITNAKFSITTPIAATSKPAFPAVASYFGGNNFNIRCSV